MYFIRNVYYHIIRYEFKVNMTLKSDHAICFGIFIICFQVRVLSYYMYVEIICRSPFCVKCKLGYLFNISFDVNSEISKIKCRDFAFIKLVYVNMLTSKRHASSKMSLNTAFARKMDFSYVWCNSF